MDLVSEVVDGDRPTGLKGFARQMRLLINSSWNDRWLLLEQNEDFYSKAIASAVSQEDSFLGDVLLQCVLRGTQEVRKVFPLAKSLVEFEDILGTDGSGSALAAIEVAADYLEGTPDGWLLGLAQDAVHIAVRTVGLTDDVFGLALSIFTLRDGVARPALERVLELMSAEWTMVWLALETEARLEDLASASAMVTELQELFYPTSTETGWARDVAFLVRRSIELNVREAVLEHRLLLSSRAAGETLAEAVLSAGDLSDPIDQAYMFADLCGMRWKKFGPAEFFHASLDLSRQVCTLLSPETSFYADAQRLLGAAVLDGVWTGILSETNFDEGIAALELSLLSTNKFSDTYGMSLSNYALALREAVIRGVRDRICLLESERCLRRAIEAVPPDSDDYRLYTLHLGSTLRTAVSYGVRAPELLPEAYAAIAESLALTRDGVETENNWFLNELGSLVSAAVEDGVLRRGMSDDAIKILRAAHTDAPESVEIMFNLGTAIGRAHEIGRVGEEELSEAVELHRKVAVNTDEPKYWGNLSNRLTQLAAVSEAKSALLSEALRAAEHAVALAAIFPQDSPDRVRFEATLGSRLMEAYVSGRRGADAILRAVELERSVRSRSSGRDRASQVYLVNFAGALDMAVRDDLLLPDELKSVRKPLEELVDDLLTNGEDLAVLACANLASLLVTGIEKLVFEPSEIIHAIEIYDRMFGGFPDARFDLRWVHSRNIAIGAAVREHLREAAELPSVLQSQRDVIDASDQRPAAERAMFIKGYMMLIGVTHNFSLLSPSEIGVRLESLLPAIIQTLRAPSYMVRRRALTSLASYIQVAPGFIVESHGHKRAVETIESLRGFLTDDIFTPAIPADFPVPTRLRTEYEDACVNLRRTQMRDREDLADPGDQSEAFRKVAELLEELGSSADYAAQSSEETWAGIRSRIRSDQALIFLITSPISEAIAVILQSEKDEVVVALPDLSRDTQVEMVRIILLDPASGDLVGQTIISSIVAPIQKAGIDLPEWIFVSTGLLSIIPLHLAVDYRDREWVDPVECIRQVPSSRFMSERGGDILAIGSLIATYSPGDIKYIMADSVAAHFVDSNLVTLSRPTIDGLASALATAGDFVFSGHASFQPEVGAGLLCTDGLLTAGDIDRLPVMIRRLAVLNACESALTALDFPEEAVGLPIGLLRAGFSGVVATSWPVRDIAAHIFILRLLQRVSVCPERSMARLVSETRVWMRSVSVVKLRIWLFPILLRQDFPQHARFSINSWLESFSWQHRPLEDHSDWGSFNYIGA